MICLLAITPPLPVGNRRYAPPFKLEMLPGEGIVFFEPGLIDDLKSVFVFVLPTQQSHCPGLDDFPAICAIPLQVSELARDCFPVAIDGLPTGAAVMTEEMIGGLIAVKDEPDLVHPGVREHDSLCRIMRQQHIWRDVLKPIEPFQFVGLDISRFGFSDSNRRSDTPDAKQGDSFCAQAEDIGDAALQAVQPLVGIYREDGRVGAPFEGIQPQVIFVVASDKDHLARCLAEEGCYLRSLVQKVVEKAKFGRVFLRKSDGGFVQPRPIGEDAQITGLKDQIELLAGLFLPASAELEAERDTAMYICKDGNVHVFSFLLESAAPA